MPKIIVCTLCGESKEHKAFGFCFDCYRKNYNQKYYLKRAPSLRKTSTLQKNCYLCKSLIYAKNYFGVANLKYCEECRAKLSLINAKESMQKRRKLGLVKEKIGQCTICKFIKKIKYKSECGACHKRSQTQNRSKPLIICPLCKLEFVQLTAHLKLHHLSPDEFKLKFPDLLLTLDNEHGTRKFIKFHGKEQFVSNQSEKLKNLIKNTPGEKEKRFERLNRGYLNYKNTATPEKIKEDGIKRGRAAINSLREKGPYHWENVAFHSKEEMEIAKLILDNPVEGINCHIPMASLEIDFFPKMKVFIEYHPNLWDNKQNKIITREQYIATRLKVLKNTLYKNIRIEFIFEQYRGTKGKEKVKNIIRELKLKYDF